MAQQRMFPITSVGDLVQQMREEANRLNEAADLLDGGSTNGTARRGPGRPRTVSASQSTNSQRRGPGRPPGSKNKPKAKPVARKRPVAKKSARKRTTAKKNGHTTHHAPTTAEVVSA